VGAIRKHHSIVPGSPRKNGNRGTLAEQAAAGGAPAAPGQRWSVRMDWLWRHAMPANPVRRQPKQIAWSMTSWPPSRLSLDLNAFCRFPFSFAPAILYLQPSSR